MNFDLKGHSRSHMVIFGLENKLFFDIFILENFILLKVETKLFFDIFSFKFLSIQNDNILKSQLTFLWTIFALVFSNNQNAKTQINQSLLNGGLLI